jgi:hypothetical protein
MDILNDRLEDEFINQSTQIFIEKKSIQIKFSDHKKIKEIKSHREKSAKDLIPLKCA